MRLSILIIVIGLFAIGDSAFAQCSGYYGGKPYWNRTGYMNGRKVQYKQFGCGQTFDYHYVQERNDNPDGPTSPLPNRGRDYGGSEETPQYRPPAPPDTTQTATQEKSHVTVSHNDAFPAVKSVPPTRRVLQPGQTYNDAKVTLHVPADAQVICNGYVTTTPGATREYEICDIRDGYHTQMKMTINFTNGTSQKTEFVIRGGQHLTFTFKPTVNTHFVQQ
jgi:hypothetical protein